MQDNDTNEMFNALVAIRDNLLKPMSNEIQNEIKVNQGSISLMNENIKESMQKIKDDIQKNSDQIQNANKEIQVVFEFNKQFFSENVEAISQIKKQLELIESSTKSQFKKVFLLFYILLFTVFASISLSLYFLMQK